MITGGVQTYVQQVEIANSTSASLAISIRPSAASRYSVTPESAQLRPGEAVAVAVRLHVSSFPNVRRGREGQRDSFIVRSNLAEQKFSATLYLRTDGAGATEPRGRPAARRRGAAAAPAASSSSRSRSHSRPRPASRSPSPAPEAIVPGSAAPGGMAADAAAAAAASGPVSPAPSAGGSSLVEAELHTLRATVAAAMTGAPEAVASMAAAVQAERDEMERKSERVLRILRAKDGAMAALRAQADRERLDLQHRLAEAQQSAAEWRARAERTEAEQSRLRARCAASASRPQRAAHARARASWQRCECPSRAAAAAAGAR